jgi:hypothetical protein
MVDKAERTARATRRTRWRGYLGVVCILGGLAVIAVDVPRLDVVLFSVSPGNGLHLSDALGAVIVWVGAALIWFR